MQQLKLVSDTKKVTKAEAAKLANSIRSGEVPATTTYKVKKYFGGNKSCAHMTTLILAIAPAAMQGYWSDRARTPPKTQPSSEMLNKYLVDTCMVWREEGPLAKELMTPILTII